MALYEKYPQNFEDMNLELVFSGRVSSRVKDKYYDRIFGVWFAILEAISEGRL
jgi:hypothetical protein